MTIVTDIPSGTDDAPAKAGRVRVFAGTHACLVDGSNMLHRAWAMGGRRQRSDGVEIAALELFSRMMVKLVRRMQDGRVPPTHLAVFFDPPREASWRREVFPGYKAARPPMDPDLASQIPMMQEMCTALGIAWAVAPRHEADDMVAAYVEDISREGGRCTIISTDKDLLQLVRPGVMQLSTVQDKWFNTSAVEQKFGIPPSRLGDYLALAGDSVDGVPGAPGIGEKTARKLLLEHGSLGAILRDPDNLGKPSWCKSIRENREIIRMSRMLVSLDHSAAPRLLDEKTLRAPSMGRVLDGSRAWREKNLDPLRA